ncbi:hypothetical protein T459_06394 [Capsicum annuum]|uniref:Folate transporter 1, chloroplastic n=1 Tax=Capsicum annuum TaxID=4072 RepID=A0A2G3AAP7_CAPAN|nr:hypothetical protein T459_06394 [Capsicum annuum]
MLIVVYDGRISNVPAYRNTPHALFAIARSELSSHSQKAALCKSFVFLLWIFALGKVAFSSETSFSNSTYFLEFPFRSYSKAKQRYLRNREELSPGLHLASAAEAGALVTHGAIQFTAYEEFRKILVSLKAQENENPLATAADLLDSVDYATLGASSKLAAILTTYPFQQRPSTTGVPRYMDSWHVVKETARFEGLRGFYRGITPNMLKNIPAASIAFIVYENVLNLLKLSRREY